MDISHSTESGDLPLRANCHGRSKGVAVKVPHSILDRLKMAQKDKNSKIDQT